MRTTQTCPKCQCRKFFVVEQVTEPNCDSRNQTHPFRLMSAELPTGKKGWIGEDVDRLDAGTLEAWVCTACGFTEWYSRGANEMLAYMMRFGGTGVRYVDADAAR